MVEFSCEECGFSVNEEDIPGDTSLCPECGGELRKVEPQPPEDNNAEHHGLVFTDIAEVQGTKEFSCEECGLPVGEEDLPGDALLCPECGGELRKVEPRPPKDKNVEHHGLVFTGSAGEYFRIWIVNLFLSIITLGIYAAWARVRTRRYFYANTKLAGHSFDYLANPKAILRGNLIIAGGIALYAAADLLTPGASAVIALIFSLALPVLIYISLKFLAHNSSFRNIRFRFCGTLGDSYITYLFIPLLLPLTLGISMPYWAFSRKRYFFDNFCFGTTENTFSGKAGSFYVYYFKAAVMFVLFILAGAFAIGFFDLGSLFKGIKNAAPTGPDLSKTGAMIVVAVYLVVLILSTLLQQYLYARLTNYCWNESSLGTFRFRSTIQARQLLWIRVTNIAAILFSLGLLAPWAKVRRTQYILDNLTVIADHSFDDFVAADESDISAVGEAATDIFGLEIGL